MDTLTVTHVAISLIGIATGFVVVYGFLTNRSLDRWHDAFLWTTIATSVTGYFFPFEKLLPSHIVGAISLVVLAIACVARYGKHLAGRWRAIYVVTAATALYLNCFVGVVQSFLKITALNALAPTQKEPPFAITQGVVLLIFVVVTVLAVKRFRASATSATAAGARG